MKRLALALIVAGAGALAAEPGSNGRAFSPQRAAAPYFSNEASAALAREDWPACAAAFARLAHGKLRVEAQLDAAYCSMKAGRYREAATSFDTLVKAYPLLADHARAWAAHALLAAGDDAQAIVRAGAVSSDSPLRGDADLTIASALDKEDKASEAADAYAAYLKAFPSSWRAPEVRVRLATALDRAGRSTEAVPVWREVELESPFSFGALAAPHRDPNAPLTAAELSRRATVLFDEMKNKESELAWRSVVTAKDATPALVCRGQYFAAQSVWKQRDRQRAAPLFEDAAKACLAAHDDDLAAKSLYQAGRANGSRAEKDKAAGERAVQLYEKLMTTFASHSYADDAALRRADVLDTLGRTDEATAALAEIPTRFPGGDQRGEALFRLAFRAFEKGDRTTARTWLERELELLPREEGWWEAGRTLYWLARSQDDAAAAAALYTRAIREYPLSYYALLAANRMERNVLEPLLDELTYKKAPPPPMVAPDRPLFHTPPFLRALELLRLGLGNEARRELTAAGIQTAKRGAKATDPELGWITAALYEVAGDFDASHAYGRYVDTAFMRRWPQGEEETEWRLTFPRAYQSLVETNVAKTGQPAALELAIIREESGFDPNLESFANAVGLTQLTAAPAARFAQGLPHDAAALRDPAINVAIGARELGQLYAAFDHDAPLAIAGYNAGEGAVRRWLRDPDNKDRQLDELVERIPYDETRGYTKRVLGSYFTYAWLDRSVGSPIARVPRIDFALPRPKRH